MEISINSLHYSYTKDTALLRELDWYCPSGSIIGLLGKNGAGKSTLLSLLIGLLKPKNDSIKIGGISPFKRDPDFLKQVFLLTDEINYPPSMSIKSYVETLAPFYPLFNASQFDNNLKDFGLGFASKLGSLSLGERKKVFLSFTLSTNCKLLLLDEPTNGLDIPSKQVFRKIVSANLSEDQTLIISTHLVKDVENLIERVAILHEGKLALDADLIELSDKFHFGYAPELVEENLYSEKHLTGFQLIRERKEHEAQTHVNLELLFNAVLNKSLPHKSIDQFQTQNA